MVTTKAYWSVPLTNRLAVVLLGFSLLVSAGLLLLNYTQLSYAILLAAPLHLLAPWLNRQKHYVLSRVVLSWLPSALGLALVIYSQTSSPLNLALFYTAQLLILLSVIVPLVLFRLDERRQMLTGLAFSFFSLIFCVAAPHFFFPTQLATDITLPLQLYMPAGTALLYGLCLVIFCSYKNFLSQTEQQLQQHTQHLSSLHASEHTQHQIIQQQSAELQEQQLKIKEAYDLIASQNNLLSNQNTQLQRHLQEKNSLLESQNVELYKRLEDFKTFNATLSHNLRGPVANLLGLCQVFEKRGAHPENMQLIEFIQRTAQELDEVIYDLSEVLDIKEEGLPQERLCISDVLVDVLVLLNEAKKHCSSQVIIDLEVDEILGVKAYLHSILFNLLSNAFKYCEPSRQGKVTVRSRLLPHEVLLEVHDNGIGIDMQKYGTELFKMYRRFSESRKGRGMGLYLVKSQSEAMGGRVLAESQLGEGTTFKIYFPQPSRPLVHI